MFTLSQLQREVAEWATHNFGKRNRAMAHQPLLGVFEELGEMADAIDVLTTAEYAHYSRVITDEDMAERTAQGKIDLLDGIADAVVFMADYCNAMELDIGSLWDGREGVDESEIPSGDDANMVISLLGKISHAHLKLSQGIRTNEDHVGRINNTLKALLCSLEHAHSLARHSSDVTLVDTVAEVWGKVKQRDWTVNKETGSAG